MNDGVHASIPALQNMEAASARLARAVVDRLPSVERELRQASDALEERSTELRREISNLHDEISSADEDEDTTWASSRIEAAEEELASLRRRSRRLAEVSASYMTQAGKLNHLATDHAIQTREFLRGTVDDLKAYFASNLNEGVSPRTDAASPVMASGQVSRADASDSYRQGLTHRPVSSSIEIAAGNDSSAASISRALVAIDEVHTDGSLPRTQVCSQDMEAFGYMQSRLSADGLTVDHMAIQPTGPWPEFTMVHETGHLLDLEGIGTKGTFASKSNDPVIQGVMKAARGSAAIRELEQQRSGADSSRRKAYFDYLLSEQEVWARVYAQFVAEHSNSKILKSQLQQALASEPGRQWSKEDFAGIDAEIKRMFNNLGWM